VVGDAAHGFDDHAFALEMLESEDVLIVPGSSFNVPERNFFRVTLLPEAPVLREVFARIERVLQRRAMPDRRAARSGRLNMTAAGDPCGVLAAAHRRMRECRRRCSTSRSATVTPSAKASNPTAAGRCNSPRCAPIGVAIDDPRIIANRLDHRRTVGRHDAAAAPLGDDYGWSRC
jgi:hypothetical protein